MRLIARINPLFIIKNPTRDIGENLKMKKQKDKIFIKKVGIILKKCDDGILSDKRGISLLMKLYSRYINKKNTKNEFGIFGSSTRYCVTCNKATTFMKTDNGKHSKCLECGGSMAVNVNNINIKNE